MRYWTFDVNNCHFERANRRVHLHEADVTVFNDDTGVQVIRDNNH